MTLVEFTLKKPVKRSSFVLQRFLHTFAGAYPRPRVLIPERKIDITDGRIRQPQERWEVTGRENRRTLWLVPADGSPRRRVTFSGESRHVVLTAEQPDSLDTTRTERLVFKILSFVIPGDPFLTRVQSRKLIEVRGREADASESVPSPRNSRS